MKLSLENTLLIHLFRGKWGSNISFPSFPREIKKLLISASVAALRTQNSFTLTWAITLINNSVQLNIIF